MASTHEDYVKTLMEKKLAYYFKKRIENIQKHGGNNCFKNEFNVDGNNLSEDNINQVVNKLVEELENLSDEDVENVNLDYFKKPEQSKNINSTSRQQNSDTFVTKKAKDVTLPDMMKKISDKMAECTLCSVQFPISQALHHALEKMHVEALKKRSDDLNNMNQVNTNDKLDVIQTAVGMTCIIPHRDNLECTLCRVSLPRSENVDNLMSSVSLHITGRQHTQNLKKISYKPKVKSDYNFICLYCDFNGYNFDFCQNHLGRRSHILNFETIVARGAKIVHNMKCESCSCHIYGTKKLYDFHKQECQNKAKQTEDNHDVGQSNRGRSHRSKSRRRSKSRGQRTNNSNMDYEVVDRVRSEVKPQNVARTHNSRRDIEVVDRTRFEGRSQNVCKTDAWLDSYEFVDIEMPVPPPRNKKNNIPTPSGSTRSLPISQQTKRKTKSCQECNLS